MKVGGTSRISSVGQSSLAWWLVAGSSPACGSLNCECHKFIVFDYLFVGVRESNLPPPFNIGFLLHKTLPRETASPALRGRLNGEVLLYKMKVKNTIRISKENINALRNLECVESVEQSGMDITVRLKPEYTDGKLESRKGEYLIQWGNKMWQRYGSEAINLLFKNPGAEAGKIWGE